MQCSALRSALRKNRGWQSTPFPQAHPWSVPEGPGAMATASCVLDTQDAPVPPVALLGLAGAVLASLGAVTMSKWCSEVSRRRAASARASRSAAVAVADKAKLKSYPEYTIDTVRLHSSAKDAWVVVGDGVYDVTKWAPRHPGGERNIVDISGRYELKGTACCCTDCGFAAAQAACIRPDSSLATANCALGKGVALARFASRPPVVVVVSLPRTAVGRSLGLKVLFDFVFFVNRCLSVAERSRSAVSSDRLQTSMRGISINISQHHTGLDPFSVSASRSWTIDNLFPCASSSPSSTL